MKQENIFVSVKDKVIKHTTVTLHTVIGELLVNLEKAIPNYSIKVQTNVEIASNSLVAEP